MQCSSLLMYSTTQVGSTKTGPRQGRGKIMADSCDLLKFLEFRTPFSDNCSLRSIVTGINASSVNVDTAK